MRKYYKPPVLTSILALWSFLRCFGQNGVAWCSVGFWVAPIMLLSYVITVRSDQWCYDWNVLAKKHRRYNKKKQCNKYSERQTKVITPLGECTFICCRVMLMTVALAIAVISATHNASVEVQLFAVGVYLDVLKNMLGVPISYYEKNIQHGVDLKGGFLLKRIVRSKLNRLKILIVLLFTNRKSKVTILTLLTGALGLITFVVYFGIEIGYKVHGVYH